LGEANVFFPSLKPSRQKQISKGTSYKKRDLKSIQEINILDSYNAEENIKGLGEYLEDVVFQYFVIKNAFPEFTVKPFLFMPDKAKTTNLEGLNGMFEIIKKPAKPGSKFISYDVNFNGKLEDILNDDILTLVDLQQECETLLTNIEQFAREFADSLKPELTKIETQICSACAGCEFHSEDPATDGFRQCWIELADAPPDILTMYRLGNVNNHHKGLIDIMIEDGKVRLKDFDADILKAENRKKQKPYYNNRPYMQLTFTEEWISDELKADLRNLKHKIHFIDFETSRMALPLA
jgi:hypothetical protein